MGDAAEALRAAVEQCRRDGRSIGIVGHNSKGFLRDGAGDVCLDTTSHAGIVDYRPQELVVTAHAGTPLAELPRLGRHLARVRHAPPQRSLARAARLRNVRGAFRVHRTLPARVALIDDVTTTGATVRAATEALLAGGAREVDVWVAAKTRAD